MKKRRAPLIVSLASTLCLIAMFVVGGVLLANHVEQSFAVSSALNKENDFEAVPASANTGDLKDIIHKTQKKVVHIESESSAGSGFIYNSNGDIVTNAHVVASVEEVTVKTSDGSSYPGTVIGRSATVDVAVVRVPELNGTESLAIQQKRGELGEEVLALGSPLGWQNTVTTGIISGVDRDFTLEPFEYENVYQMSAPIAPGNSGGPLVEVTTGRVIGINSAKADQGDIGFSIPIIDVIPMIDEWIENPLTELPSIAVSDFQEMDSFSETELANYLVSYFYDSLSQGDYVTAYSLLGSQWKQNTSYESFRNGYQNTLDVSVDELLVTEEEDGYYVTAFISALERDAELSYQSYKVTYFLRYENDQMKIISGEGERL